MARKIFFISVALIPLVCAITFFIPPPESSDAVEQMSFFQNVGTTAFYIIIFLIIVAFGAAIYDRVNSSKGQTRNDS